MNVEIFFDKNTFTATYVVFDESTKDAVVIDSVLDYDNQASELYDDSFKKVLSFLKEHELKLHYILETHVHADHLTAAPLFKDIYPQAMIVIGENIKTVQEVFKSIYNLDSVLVDGSQFDYLIKDEEVITAGSLKIKAMNTPGHTPACLTYDIEGTLFTGDALFMPDMGTGRCDFPKGSAVDLYHSIQKIYSYPDDTVIYVGHDYAPGGRDYKFSTTVGEQKKNNVQLKESTSLEEFSNFRSERDATLNAPKLLLPSIQVNMVAGNLPKPENNGERYLKIPLSTKGLSNEN